MRPFIVLYSLLAVLILPSGYALAQQAEHQHPVSRAPTDVISGQTRYVCPMHSHIVKDHPGTCPICGMNLEPVVQKARNEGSSVVIEITGDTRQAMSIVTEQVKRDDLWKFVRTLGTVGFDESAIMHFHPRAAGYLESLDVHTQGQKVKKGQRLFTLYSPELVVAQEDYLQVLKNAASSSREHLITQGRLRLKLLGMDESVIKQVEDGHKALYTVPYYAPQDGVVTELNVREGMYVTPDVELLSLADLTRLWVIADVFESQFDWVKLGKPAEIHLPHLGMHGDEASIDYIYPQLDPVTRSLKVRLTLSNPLERVKPGMTAEVKIFGGPLRDVLVVSKQAVIPAEQGHRIVVQRDDSSFEVREVEIGMQAQGKVEVLSGLKDGERVVTSGQFLIDAEASLAGGLERLDAHAHH
ncbi:efflux RND transporter periplasmic adaptor subunit [Aliiglaciecola sp. CAU 1673]|uniref:efflux RND transporter periplasmic adaptor subunit n=1 Tax=Aliiglaciecola sp. CAU 1673 TaxID=3032595 RepID=UPI0023DA90D2|nr:efflux RND transporter periplasmic adaptor subunit [Aliiglaciecola sp. CAU 1673]MDF2179527.1 efflux RND transporter periplasmic adaptor subunit [Aliiglaciecola sp. CAU 1673]